jgi:GTPase SAR1 family protein
MIRSTGIAMRLVEIFARDVKPLKFAHITDLSDTIVIAGPNGVGKTRLIEGLLQHIQNPRVDPNFRIRIQATNTVEESAWKKTVLDTSVVADVELLRTTLQKSRRRTHFSSSFLNFESNRSIQKVDQYNWDWNFGDPFEEEVRWNIGMQNMTARFNDMVHSIFRKIRSRREAIALYYEELIRSRDNRLADKSISAIELKGISESPIQIDPHRFPDALGPFKAAFSQLLAPKELTALIQR